MTDANSGDQKRPTDWEAIERIHDELIDKVTGVEADIVRLFVLTAKTENPELQEDRIPMSHLDTVVCEMAFKFGRADIVVFHIDGSASVIEAKDGSRGYTHVVAGIGQAGLYAAQLGMSKGGITKIRRCLLWTSTGNVDLDAVIETTCLKANVVPLPWGSIKEHIAYRDAVNQVVGGAAHG
jgi:hypothetical protein